MPVPARCPLWSGLVRPHRCTADRVLPPLPPLLEGRSHTHTCRLLGFGAALGAQGAPWSLGDGPKCHPVELHFCFFLPSFLSWSPSPLCLEGVAGVCEERVVTHRAPAQLGGPSGESGGADSQHRFPSSASTRSSQRHPSHLPARSSFFQSLPQRTPRFPVTLWSVTSFLPARVTFDIASSPSSFTENSTHVVIQVSLRLRHYSCVTGITAE